MTLIPRSLILRKVLKRFKHVEPREFCEYWLQPQPHEKDQWGYRQRCIEFIAEVLNKPVSTVSKWGSGADFEKTPDLAKTALTYLHEVCKLHEALSKVIEDVPKSHGTQHVLNQRNGQG